jgi:hypothetical protein
MYYRKPIPYYVCADLDPSADEVHEFKFFSAVEAGSALLYVVTKLRIQWYKRKAVGPEPHHVVVKNQEPICR